MLAKSSGTKPLFHVLKGRKYEQNVSFVKVYGKGDNKRIKITTVSTVRAAGIIDDDDAKALRGTVNDTKLRESICRARSKIFEYAFCNPWAWFFTATLDPKKYNRADLDKFHKDLTQWLRDYGKKHNIKIKFLLIPELHADGKSWHMHGFLHGLPVSHLKQFKVGDKMGKGLAEKVLNGDTVFDWLAYKKKFGFCDLEAVRNQEAAAKYVTKYVSKSLVNSVKELNAHLYYCSRGLETAETIKKGTMISEIIAPDFVSEYCSITWLPYSDDMLHVVCDTIV